MVDRLLSPAVRKTLGGGLTTVMTLAAVAAPVASSPVWGQAREDVEALRHAAERGDADAQYALADAYANFLVESMEDAEAEAVRWYRLAADQGHAGAQLELGRRHEQGWGVPTDHAEAARWYRRAARQGNHGAQFSLGTLYRDGRGLTRDLVQAYTWLSLAITGARAEDQRHYRTVRNQVADAMTPAQVAEAEHLARQGPTTP